MIQQLAEKVERVAGDTKWSFWKLLKYSIAGISSQYLAKTYLEVKKRPHFIVARTNAKHSYKIK